MTRILATKPGALSAANKKLLARNGVVLIECDDPAGVRLIDPETSPLIAADLLLAAMRAIQHSTNSQTKFSEYFRGLIERRWKEREDGK